MALIKLAPKKVQISLIEELLSGWHSLNKPLSKTDSIGYCVTLLRYELQHANRQFILDRIKSRIIKLSTCDVRKELNEYCTKIREKANK